MHVPGGVLGYHEKKRKKNLLLVCVFKKISVSCVLNGLAVLPSF